MTQQALRAFDQRNYSGTGPENYERYFVPAIGAPAADDLIEVAAIKAGERVLDVACGTGVVTRLAAERAGKHARVAAVDINPGMLAVARAAAPDELPIDWYETSAEAMPLQDASFDVILCQMGLQFMSNKAGALAEMHRVLAPGGRVVITLPGPTPPMFTALADALTKNIRPDAGKFAHAVFSLHDAGQIRALLTDAGFDKVEVEAKDKDLQLPPPADFLWQYVYSTPLGGVVAKASEQQKVALERDVCERWRQFASGGGMKLELTMNTVTAAKRAA